MTAMQELIAKFGRYLLTGGIAALVDAGGFALLEAVNMAVPLAAATSFCVAAAVNFQMTSRFVFEKNATSARFALFFACALIGLVVNVTATLTAITYLNLPSIAAKIAGIGMAFMLNFSLNVGIVFRKQVTVPGFNPISNDSAEVL